MLAASGVKDRIASVDALRGFALLGILLANIPYPGEYGLHPDDGAWVVHLFHLLIDKKFITIFSILFGFGFYIQSQRSASAGVDFIRYYAIRMGLLFFIGCLHGYGLWFGDIIRAYALGGFFLLLLYKLSTRTLVFTAVFFNVILTGIFFIGNSAFDWRIYDYDYHLAAEHYLTPSFLRYLQINFTIDTWVNFVQDMPITLAFTFGNMIIGVLLGRWGFFLQKTQARKVARQLAMFGLPAGIASSFVIYGLTTGTIELSFGLIWLPFVLIVGLLLQSLAYVSIFLLAYQHARVRTVLALFNPVGRTALTNYVLQSVFYLFIFFHLSFSLKLHGRLDNASTLLLGIALFGLQVVVSSLWLSRFRQGPIEMAWKRVAYRFTRNLRPRAGVVSA